MTRRRWPTRARKAWIPGKEHRHYGNGFWACIRKSASGKGWTVTIFRNDGLLASNKGFVGPLADARRVADEALIHEYNTNPQGAA